MKPQLHPIKTSTTISLNTKTKHENLKKEKFYQHLFWLQSQKQRETKTKLFTLYRERILTWACYEYGKA